MWIRYCLSLFLHNLDSPRSAATNCKAHVQPQGMRSAMEKIRAWSTIRPMPLTPIVETSSSWRTVRTSQHNPKFGNCYRLFFCNIGQPPSTRAYTYTLNVICGQQWSASWPHQPSCNDSVMCFKYWDNAQTIYMLRAMPIQKITSTTHYSERNPQMC